MVGVEPCAYVHSSGSHLLEAGEVFRQDLFGDTWGPAGKRIGLSINSIAPDRGDADSMTGNRSEPWQKFSVGATLNGMGMPVAFEWGDNPTGGAAKTQDPYQYNYWTMLSAAGAHGDFALPQWTWNPYWTDPAWEINDYWFNSDRPRLARLPRSRMADLQLVDSARWPQWHDRRLREVPDPGQPGSRTPGVCAGNRGNGTSERELLAFARPIADAGLLRPAAANTGDHPGSPRPAPALTH